MRVAGKTLLVAGVALDALESGTAIDKALKDVDKKLGKKSVSTAAKIKIGGRWARAAAGAQIGAWAGAFTGPAAPVFVPCARLDRWGWAVAWRRRLRRVGRRYHICGRVKRCLKTCSKNI